MELTIIILSYNTKKLTAECVKSIAKSRPKVRYEIIVVDNASADGSVEVIKKLQKEYRLKLILNLVQNDTNLGFARGNNVGIKRAKGKYILLLNSDTKVKGRAIDEMYQFAKKTDDAGVVGARLLNKDGSRQGSVSRLPTVGRAVRQYWWGQKGVLEKYAPSGSEPVEVEAVVGAAFLMTPKARKKVGLLDERYFMYFEDLDYCRKVRSAGLKVYYLASAEVIHFHGESGKKLRSWDNQWRRLIPSSKIYHGIFKHYLFNFILWSGQKLRG